MKTLRLSLKTQYFNEIKAGTKTEEYRLCTPFWKKRIEGKRFDCVEIRLGYPKNGDESKIVRFAWDGYVNREIIHPHFGNKLVKVYAIALTGSRLIQPLPGIDAAQSAI
jgi:hypothetical protein